MPMTNRKGSGGYRNLRSYQQAEIVYDLTVEFCDRYLERYSRTNDQMIQAARSGKQNIVEGSQASRTSRKGEIKLIGVARASLEELLADYQDFLRQGSLPRWDKDSGKAKKIRSLAYQPDRSYLTYKSYMNSPETAANVAICLISQTNYLLDRQIDSLEKEFINKGGYTENLFQRRIRRQGRDV